MYVLMVYSHGEGYSYPVAISKDREKIEAFMAGKMKGYSRKGLKEHDLEWDLADITTAINLDD